MIEIGFCCVTGNIHPERNSGGHGPVGGGDGWRRRLPQAPRQTRQFGNKISPPHLCISIPILLFHLQMVGTSVNYLPFPSNCNHDHCRPQFLT